MLTLQHIAYTFPDKGKLFDNISFSVKSQDKIALIGNNGSGKSTILKIIAKELTPAGGHVKTETQPYYIPQVFGQYNHLSIGRALQVEDKLNALQEILKGNATESMLSLLDDDWSIESRCEEALNYWQLNDVQLTQSMGSLSGGQKTKVFLAGISIHQPGLILLDEPSNHLDVSGRQALYDFIQSTKSTVLMVSHDRRLLNLVNQVCELHEGIVTIYGGNYDFYTEQKEIERNALHQDIHSKEKALRKAREKERESLERQQKLDSRGKKKQEKAGVARIMMNTLRNKAENSTSKIKSVHAEKTGDITHELQTLRASLPDIDKMKFGFDNSLLHKGKLLFSARQLNFSYSAQTLWAQDLSFQITSGERIALSGKNGSGKTTLIKLMLGQAEPGKGEMYRAAGKSVYIDQDYSLIDNKLKVYEQAQQFNVSGLQEHEVKIRLNRFLFGKEDWEKNCGVLSGGERMRLMLCCLVINNTAPDIIVLDEPTNNLDIQNIEILTAALNDYQGTLIVVSHDETFLKQIHIERTIVL